MDDISNIIFHLMGLGFFLFLSSFFSSAETALFSLSEAKVEKLRQGSSKIDKFVAGILDNPRRLLITILVCDTLVNVASASIIASFATALLGNKGIGVAIGITTVLLLVFGEITPKTIAINNAEPISKLVAYPLEFFSRLIFPIRIILSSMTESLVQFMSSDDVVSKDKITTEELKTMVDIAEEEGLIEQQEKEIINAIFDLRNITAAEIMVPRTEMICASDNSTLQQVFDLARSTGHSRIPVYRDDIDYISGIAYIRDFLMWRRYNVNYMTVEQFLNKHRKIWPHGKNTLIREPFFAPETRTGIGLLQDFRKHRIRMAILLDEYGGTAGLVTMNDLLEELVGEISSERDNVPEGFRQIDELTTIMSGGASIRNVNKRLDLNLPTEGDIDTIGGYVVSLIGRIPELGEIIFADGLEFKITGEDGRRITEILIRKFQEKEEEYSG